MKQALLSRPIHDRAVCCALCAHRCVIAEEAFGFCGVRQNRDGVLYTHTYGAVCAATPDPIEKKPLYHFLPGHRSFSIATRGCNFRCGFCQNWEIAHIPKTSVRDSGLGTSSRHRATVNPEEIIEGAISNKCKSIAYTYTEPTIFFEYALDCARLAREKNIKNIFVTNGFMTSEALEVIAPYLDAANVDLKSFSDDFYQAQCKGRLQPVLDTIRHMKKRGVWVEITTLVIPGYNDSAEELYRIAAFIASVDKNIPWHISRFHADHQFADTPATSLESLRTAYAIGKNAGLNYVYLGNVAEGGDTVCPDCGATVISRQGYVIKAGNTDLHSLRNNSCCAECGERIAGMFL